MTVTKKPRKPAAKAKAASARATNAIRMNDVEARTKNDRWIGVTAIIIGSAALGAAGYAIYAGASSKEVAE